MHKKYTILAAGFLLFSSAFIWSSISREESKRREFLYSLDRKDKLNRVHYSEYGDQQLTVLDKDIVIIKKTCKKILTRKNNAKRVFFFYMTCLKIMQLKTVFELLRMGITLVYCSSVLYRDLKDGEVLMLYAALAGVASLGLVSFEIIKLKICFYVFNHYIKKNDEFRQEQEGKWSLAHDIIIQLKQIKKEVIQSL